jgi:hypothetical protein
MHGLCDNFFDREDILTGKTDPISLTFRDDTINEVYNTGIQNSMKEILQLVTHKHCTANILEIGAGSNVLHTHSFF